MGLEEDKKQRQIDLDDLNNEIAGRDTGRQARFLTGASAKEIEERRERDEREFQDQLERLLLDPLYRQTYERVWKRLDETQESLDHAVLKTTDAIERLNLLRGQLEAKARKLADGTAVFRAADGSIFTADGRRLSDADSASLQISLEAPSYEQYKGVQDALDSANARQKKLADIQTEVLDPIREKLNDRTHPPSKDEMDEFDTRLKNVVSEDLKLDHRDTFAGVADPQSDGSDPDDLDLTQLDISQSGARIPRAETPDLK